jgi:type IV pilus assembly protein PilY1
VYIGSNDGMLHALNATTGQEIFCYVPNMVYGHLSELSLPSYNHKYYVDGTATAATVNNKEILVCGLGKGAKGYFGLNITNPGSPVALWEYTGDDDLGYSFSKAIIINTEEEGRVVMFGNGYDSVSETAALFFLDPEDGSLIKKIDTGETSCNGLATPSAVDVNGDGAADFVFAGDLHGNMWKFDIRGAASGWKVYYGDQPLVSVGNSAGVVQPITTAPEVMLDCARSDFSRQGAGMMVLFGTGRYLNNDDFGNADIQSFYGVWDWGDIWEKKSGYDIAKTKYLGIVEGAERLLSNIDGASLQEQTVSDAGNGWKSMSNNQVEWYDPETNTGEHMGWVFDMPAEGERGVREPDLIGNGVLELISIIPSSSPCECGGNSILYRVSACSGGYTSDPQFDTNDDGKIDEEDENFGGKEMENMIFEGISIGDQRYYPDTEAGIDPEKKEPIPLGMQYFRVIQ